MFVVVALHAFAEDGHEAVGVDLDAGRVLHPDPRDLVEELLPLARAGRPSRLRKEPVELLDADVAEVEADPALGVVAEQIAGLDHSRTVDPDERLRLVLLER